MCRRPMCLVWPTQRGILNEMRSGMETHADDGIAHCCHRRGRTLGAPLSWDWKFYVNRLQYGRSRSVTCPRGMSFPTNGRSAGKRAARGHPCDKIKRRNGSNRSAVSRISISTYQNKSVPSRRVDPQSSRTARAIRTACGFCAPRTC